MDDLFFNECFQNLYYAEEAMKNWIPLTDYEIIFEAVNPEIQNKLLKNEETANKSVGFIQKAINTVLKIINTAINGIKEFFARLTMGDDEKNKYEQFKAELARDPKLKNKQVSVIDFREISKHYDSLISEIDTEIKAVESDPYRPTDSLFAKVNEFLGKDVPVAASIVGAQLAVNIADSNIDMAKALSTILNNEKDIMDTLTKNLGKSKANATKRAIDAAAKNTKLHQLKVLVCRKKSNSLQECLTKSFKNIFSLAPMAFSALGNKDLRNVAWSSYKYIREGNKLNKEAEKQKLKNAKEQEKAKKQAEKDAAKAEKQAVKQAKIDEKHKDDPRYKSKADFITGN